VNSEAKQGGDFCEHGEATRWGAIDLCEQREAKTGGGEGRLISVDREAKTGGGGAIDFC